MMASKAGVETNGPVSPDGDQRADGVRVASLAKRFGETKALVNASLHAVPGEIHAIVGENGSGKSTLAKILSGVVLPDTGEVRVFGASPRTPEEAIAAGVATIFQEILVAEDLSVVENVFAGSDGLWRRRISRSEKRRRAAEVMARLVGAPVDPDARVRPLPLAIKQWIVIARALLSRPRLLIMDESSAALDLDATQRLHQEMRQLKSAGCTILLVTHRIAELIRIADAATVLRDGVTVGTLDKVHLTEDCLIALMSGESAATTATAAGSERRIEDVVLSVRHMRVRPGAPAFDFEVRAGEIVGLAGLDGAGQTEFARTLVGIDRPIDGLVLAGGVELTTQSVAAASGIAYVSGDRKREGIFPQLSILENFAIALMKRQARAGVIDADARDAAFAKAAGQFSFRFSRDSDRITTMSGGNQQKVLIARAFAQDPGAIVLNDPARGVDIGTKQALWRHLRTFAAAGGAVVYLSSEIEEFPGFADRVDVFAGGTLLVQLVGRDINEDRILAALFGRKEAVSFDTELETI